VSNKINSLSNRPTELGPGRAVTPARDATTGGSGNSTQTSGDGDVHITGSAAKLASLEQALRDLPAVDEARVAQVRTALEQGQYTVRPEHVADQLLAMEKSLAQLTDAGGSSETTSSSDTGS
jgi:negative regulator of flagellin synthesis FlgM